MTNAAASASSLEVSRETVIPLAAGFAPASREDWISVVERTLKGASVNSLVRHTLEGLEIQPLYGPGAQPPAAIAGRGGADWDVRALVRRPRPAEANGDVLQDLQGGAGSVLLQLGAGGVAIASADDMARALDGVLLDAAPVALDAGFLGPKSADWLAAAAKGAPSAELVLHMDPIGAFARDGLSSGPMESHLIAAATVGVRLAEPYPRASLFLASGRAAHEAGAGEAAELALAAAAAVAYAKALARAGLTIQAAFERIVIGLAVDADYFLGVAKLRAARLVWGKITAACGVAAPARIEARSSGRMLTRADPWTNMIRLTAAGFAAAVGGADAIVLGAFTDAMGRPSAFARRQARNAQLVLKEEANLGRVTDPAAGSGYLEALTDELARAAWTRFQAIEAAGGAIRALEAGLVAQEAARGRELLAQRIAAGELKVLGVTDFPNAETGAVELGEDDPASAEQPPARLPGPDSRSPPLLPVRLEELA
ncbi:MAG: methylmalonyl-CoA mutase family protein [Caulobacterales bacterium]